MYEIIYSQFYLCLYVGAFILMDVSTYVAVYLRTYMAMYMVSTLGFLKGGNFVDGDVSTVVPRDALDSVDAPGSS